MLPYDVVKDNNGNVIVIHHGAKLGEGSYGPVYIGQVIAGQDMSKTLQGAQRVDEPVFQVPGPPSPKVDPPK